MKSKLNIKSRASWMELVFRTVKQKHPMTCGVACLAMATGMEYDYIHELLDNSPTAGSSMQECAAVLALHDINLGYVWSAEGRTFEKDLDDTDFYLDLEHRPAFLGVLSEKREIVWDGNRLVDGGHWVFFDGFYVRDPNPQVPDERFIEEYRNRIIDYSPLIYWENPDDA